MAQLWMVRAGEGSAMAAEFERGEFVGIGWNEIGDLTGLTSREAIRTRLTAAFPHKSAGTIATWTGQLYKIRSSIEKGDRVVTYDSTTREYLLGTIVGDYEHRSRGLRGHENARRVKWEGSNACSDDERVRYAGGASPRPASQGSRSSQHVRLFPAGDRSLERMLADPPMRRRRHMLPEHNAG